MEYGIYAVLAVLFVMILLASVLYGCTKYLVWRQGLEGEAELARAEQNRKIAVQEAEAKKEQAKGIADAEVIRAKGVAEVNQIISESLKNNEGNLRYLWIQGLNDNQQNVIYAPTEAGLPTLEAGKRRDINN